MMKKYLITFMFLLFSQSVYANTITITTGNLLDNGYDNTNPPRQSFASHLDFTTTGTTQITVNGTTTLYGMFTSELGLWIDGVAQSPLVFTANGAQAFTVNLSAGDHAVSVVVGLQSDNGGSTVFGSFIDSVSTASGTLTALAPTPSNRIVIYGDSISVGQGSTYPEELGWDVLLRTAYSHEIMIEAWGRRSLYDDTHAGNSAFVSRIASYNPSKIWLAIGTNDYGVANWSAASFGTAYASLLDAIHAAMPVATIYCQTPLVRTDEGANSAGSTMADYRAQITTAVSTRASFAILKDGTQAITTSDLSDNVHPTTAGHAKYATWVNNNLGTPYGQTTLTGNGSLSLTGNGSMVLQ